MTSALLPKASSAARIFSCIGRRFSSSSNTGRNNDNSGPCFSFFLVSITSAVANLIIYGYPGEKYSLQPGNYRTKLCRQSKYMNRRDFLRLPLIGVPLALVDRALGQKSASVLTMRVKTPVVASTWDRGITANSTAWPSLQKHGSAL